MVSDEGVLESIPHIAIAWHLTLIDHPNPNLLIPLDLCALCLNTSAEKKHWMGVCVCFLEIPVLRDVCVKVATEEDKLVKRKKLLTFICKHEKHDGQLSSYYSLLLLLHSGAIGF